MLPSYTFNFSLCVLCALCGETLFFPISHSMPQFHFFHQRRQVRRDQRGGAFAHLIESALECRRDFFRLAHGFAVTVAASASLAKSGAWTMASNHSSPGYSPQWASCEIVSAMIESPSADFVAMD
jgi:hypothetical protein